MNVKPSNSDHCGRFTILDVVVDAFLIVGSCGLIRLVPAMIGAEFNAVYFAFSLVVVVTGRLCRTVDVARIGAVLGAMVIGPGLVVPATLSMPTPDYVRLGVLLPIFSLLCAATTSLFFVVIQRLQQLGRTKARPAFRFSLLAMLAAANLVGLVSYLYRSELIRKVDSVASRREEIRFRDACDKLVKEVRLRGGKAEYRLGPVPRFDIPRICLDLRGCPINRQCITSLVAHLKACSLYSSLRAGHRNRVGQRIVLSTESIGDEDLVHFESQVPHAEFLVIGPSDVVYHAGPGECFAISVAPENSRWAKRIKGLESENEFDP